MYNIIIFTHRIDRRFLQALYHVRQVVAQVRRLVIARVLPGYRFTVNRIVHQRINAVRRRHRSRNYIDLGGIPFRAQKELFTPVTQDIRYKQRVISLTTGQAERFRTIQEELELSVLTIELGQDRAIQEFVLQIPIEIDSEINRDSIFIIISPIAIRIRIMHHYRNRVVRIGLEGITLHRTHHLSLGRPEFVTTVSGIDIGSNSPTIVFSNFRSAHKNCTVGSTQFIHILGLR